MDTTTKKILSLLKSGDREVQLSAIRILAELGIKDRLLAKGIGELLGKTQDSVIKDALLEIPVRSPSKDYLPYLIPFLSDLAANREKVIRAISAAGSLAIPQLTKRYPKALPFEKRAILTTLSRIPNRNAYVLLLEALWEGRDVEHLKFVCDLLRSVTERMEKADRKWLTHALLKLIRKPQVKKVNSFVISCLILISNLQDPKTKSAILSVLHQSKDIFVMKYALIALARLGFKGKGYDDVLKALLPILNHADFSNVVKYALQVMEPLDVSKKMQTAISKLLESPHASVRSYALSKLGSFDSSENVSTLIEYLNSPDIRIREASKTSLEKMPKAVLPLLKLFDSDLSPEKADQITTILRAHKKAFKPAVCKKLLISMERLLKQKNDKYRNHLQLLKNVNPDILYKYVLGKVTVLKKKAKWMEAVTYLGLLQDSYLYTNEARYEMAILTLKTSKKDLSAGFRDQDKSLQLFQTMIKNNPDELMKKLLKERKVILPQDFYYLGFHFSEKLFELREFGIRLLKHQIKKQPSSSVSKLAKRKLASIGLGAKLVSV